jgi:HlyD family secretion protein
MDVITRPDVVLRKPRHVKRWAFGALPAVAVGLALLYVGLQRPPATHYLSGKVDRGEVVRSVSASGTVNPVLTIIVGSYVSGVIQQLECDFNTQVKVGQVCARIDPRPYQVVVDQDRAELATARAQLAKDQAGLEYLKVNYERLALLLTQNSAAKDTVDLARSAYGQALAQVSLDQATIQQKAAALKAAEINLGYTNITAPVDGTVVARNVTQGQTVAASFQTPTLFLIAKDLADMQIDANVSESDIGQVRPGQAVQFSVEAHPDRQFDGTVMQVRQAPQTVQNVVTYDVVISVDNRNHLLLPGMTATLRIVTARRSGVLRVPDQALRYVPSDAQAARVGAAGASPAASRPVHRVWLLRDGEPHAVTVTTGLDDDTFTEITAGALVAGDRVIIGETTGAATEPSRRPVRFGL